MWSTTPVHRWEMSGWWPADAPPELPPDVDQDELQRMEEGVGPLLRRIYRTEIVGSASTAEGLMGELFEDLDRVAHRSSRRFRSSKERRA
jgi:hypothetical protein